MLVKGIYFPFWERFRHIYFAKGGGMASGEKIKKRKEKEKLWGNDNT